MNKLILVTCLLLSGCLHHFDQAAESVDDQSEGQETLGDPPAGNSKGTEPYSCQPTQQEIVLANGDKILVIIPVGCNQFNLDQGDPPPDGRKQAHQSPEEIQALDIVGKE